MIYESWRERGATTSDEDHINALRDEALAKGDVWDASKVVKDWYGSGHRFTYETTMAIPESWK